jgi:hypothetical protein
MVASGLMSSIENMQPIVDLNSIPSTIIKQMVLQGIEKGCKKLVMQKLDKLYYRVQFQDGIDDFDFEKAGEVCTISSISFSPSRNCIQ